MYVTAAAPRRPRRRTPAPRFTPLERHVIRTQRRAAYLRDAIAAADPHLDFARYDLVYLVA
ncbi:M6 family metalloprotease domain-containing protein, partial [Streptomyces asiaticus]